MTTQPLTLELEPRTVVGKKVRQLRRQGITPVHLYGMGIEPLSVQAESAAVQRLAVQAGGNIPISVTVKGHQKPYFAFIREVQRHPLTEAILHVDFYQVTMTEVMQTEVPIYLTGEAPGVRMLNGVLFQALHSFRVECLPLDVPQYVELDIAQLDDFEKALHISDISVGDKVTVLNDPDEVIARVNAPRVAVEEEAIPGAEAEAPEEGAPAQEAQPTATEEESG
ncbi:MAG: 50S ribosomal protein L25 [Chloroflexi bacterium]|nr:50S ribosomal protein L25 [Chloroflexota bacterium]